MTTRNDLIPDGLPYGERGQIEAATRQAGLPTETRGGTPPAPALPPAPIGPGEADILTELQPTMPLLEMPARQDAGEDMLVSMEVSGDPIFVDLARRIREGR